MSGQTDHLREETRVRKHRKDFQNKRRSYKRRKRNLVGEFVLLLVVKRQLVIQDVVQILLHENHGVGETVLLVVSAVVHVGVVAEGEKLFKHIYSLSKNAMSLMSFLQKYNGPTL